MTSDSQAAGPIVFLHIFKSAGSSVQFQLRAQLGKDAVQRVNDGPDFPGRVAAALAQPGCKVLAGHFTYRRIDRVLTELGHANPAYFAFVRDPVDRLVSAYNYFRKTESERWHAEAMHMDINEFLPFMTNARPQAMKNHQCWALASAEMATFAAAIATVKARFAFLGCAENLAASNEAASALLGFEFDAGVRRNWSPRRRGAQDFTPETQALVEKITAEEQKLYNYARAQLGLNDEEVA